MSKFKERKKNNKSVKIETNLEHNFGAFSHHDRHCHRYFLSTELISGAMFLRSLVYFFVYFTIFWSDNLR